MAPPHSKLKNTRVSNKSGLEEESSAILFYLNASINLSKFPIMMQTQIQATNMRWVGRTFKSLQPYLVPMPNTFIGNNWLSHNIAKQKYDDQLWTGREILQEITVQQLTWNRCEISQPASVNNSIQISNYNANTDPSNQYETRRDNF